MAVPTGGAHHDEGCSSHLSQAMMSEDQAEGLDSVGSLVPHLPLSPERGLGSWVGPACCPGLPLTSDPGSGWAWYLEAIKAVTGCAVHMRWGCPRGQGIRRGFSFPDSALTPLLLLSDLTTCPPTSSA